MFLKDHSKGGVKINNRNTLRQSTKGQENNDNKKRDERYIEDITTYMHHTRSDCHVC